MPEPVDFDDKVRKPGHAWIRDQGLSPHAAPPAGCRIPPYWRAAGRQLWLAYSGICAYLAIFFEFATGASTTDHFVAKSESLADAYEWSNYRLACQAMNRNKGAFDDVLDPFLLRENTFFINFASGEIFPNPALEDDVRKAALRTISRLRLNSPENCGMRAGHYGEYVCGNVSLDFLRRHSPFVHAEIVRQKLER